MRCSEVQLPLLERHFNIENDLPMIVNSLTHFVRTIHTPIGVLRIACTEQHIVSLDWNVVSPDEGASHHPLLLRAEQQLLEYIDGTRWAFDLPLEPKGTEFQKKVWTELVNIHAGETRTYTDIAVKVGGREKTRAVGTAIGQNPILIFIPCHRVIGRDGKLTGYAGGLHHKRWLLQHEDPMFH